MSGANPNSPSSAVKPVIAVAVSAIAYLAVYYATVQRPTVVACQYYAFTWNGGRYFLDESLFYPVDWLDRRIGVTEWRRLRQVGIAHHGYYDVRKTFSDGADKR
jgi:hypothetical protein